MSIPAAVRSTSYVWSRLIGGMTGKNSPEGMDVHLSCLLCIVQVTASRKGDHSFRRVLLAVCVWKLENSTFKGPSRELVVFQQKIKH